MAFCYTHCFEGRVRNLIEKTLTVLLIEANCSKCLNSNRMTFSLTKTSAFFGQYWTNYHLIPPLRPTGAFMMKGALFNCWSLVEMFIFVCFVFNRRLLVYPCSCFDYPLIVIQFSIGSFRTDCRPVPYSVILK